MKLRKPRISLKWLLIGFAIVAVGMYVFYIYLTQRAEQLIAAINHGNLHPYDVVERPQTPFFTNQGRIKITSKTAVAQMLPRTWSDTWHARRLLSITMTWSMENSKYAILHQDVFVSNITGYHMYNWNERQVRLRDKEQ